MPCVSGRAEMSGIRDATMVRASGVNATFCTLLNGSGKVLPEVLAVADAISPPMAGLRVNHGQQRGVRCR